MAPSALDGKVEFAIQQEDEFFDIDKSTMGLVPVRTDVWQGFIFINFDDEAGPVAAYLGRFATNLDAYPFSELKQAYKYRTVVNANWKLYIDAFAEFYHAPFLHSKQYVGEESRKLLGHGYQGLHYELDGVHGMQSSWGGMAPPKDPMMVKPTERILRSGNFGPWDRPDVAGLDAPPPGLNPNGHRAWGLDSYLFFPNFMMVVWAPGWYLTYHYWPTAYNQHIFEGTLYFVPAKTATERLRQEDDRGDVQGVRTTGLQHPRGDADDAADPRCARIPAERPGTHAARTAQDSQRLRHCLSRRTTSAATAAQPDGSASMSTLPSEFADLEPYVDWALPTEPERYAKRLASTMPEIQAFYDAALPRLADAATYLDQFELNALPEDALRLLHLCYSLINISFPVEAWGQARVPDSGASTFDCIYEPAV